MSKDVVLRIKINDTNGVKTIGDINAAATTTLTTINELEDAARLLNEELANTDRSTQRFQELSQQLRVVNTELRNQDLALEALDNEQFAAELKSVTGGLMDMVGGLQLIGVSGGSLEEIAQTFAKVEGASKIAAGAIELYSSGMKIANNLIVRATAASAAQAAATTAQGNASVFAAAKMRILNAVMNANPVFLLITGLTAAATAMYAFTKYSAEATQKEKERADEKKRAIALSKAAKEEQDKESKSIAEQSSKFVGLIVQLKSTNENSKERSRLIKEINSQYGTSLKNLSDENEFQKQLNLAIKEYIDYQKIKYLVSKNEDLITRNLEKQDKLETQLKEKRDEYKKWLDDIKKQGISRGVNVTLENEISELEDELKKAEKRLESYGFNITKANEKIKDITDNGKKYVEQSKGEVKTTEEKTKSNITYTKTLFDISKALEEAKQKQDEYNKSLGENTIEELNKVEEAKQKRIELEREYNLLLGEERGKARTAAFEQLKKDLETEKSTFNLSAVEKQVIEERYFSNRRNLIKETNELILQDLNTISASFNEAISGNFSSAADSINDMSSAVNSLYDSLNLTIKSFEDGTFEEIATNITSMAAALTDITTDLIGSIANKQFEEDNKLRESLFNEEQEKYQDMLANRLITQEEYDTKVRNLEQQKRESERKARQDLFASEKKLGIADAIMNTAQAVTSALATGGPIAGPILAGVVGGLGAVQIGIIKGQEFTAARGGIVPDNGRPSNIDSVNALLAPGETVINSNSSSMFGELLNMINVAGGGVPLMPSSLTSNTQRTNVENDNKQFNFNIKANVLESDMTRVQKNVSKMRNSGRLF